jgi:hypothetical protein
MNVEGEHVTIDLDGPPAQAEWAKTRYGIATQTLPNGYCGLPLEKQWPHANASDMSSFPDRLRVSARTP